MREKEERKKNERRVTAAFYRGESCTRITCSLSRVMRQGWPPSDCLPALPRLFWQRQPCARSECLPVAGSLERDGLKPLAAKAPTESTCFCGGKMILRETTHFLSSLAFGPRMAHDSVSRHTVMFAGLEKAMRRKGEGRMILGKR